MVFQREIAPETGMRHLQCFVYFKSATSFERVREFLRHPTRGRVAHIEYARASAGKNRSYCSKQDSRDPAPGSGPFEFGKVPLDNGKRRDFNEACELARDGVALTEIARTYPTVFVRYNKGLQALSNCTTVDRTEYPMVIWYFGPTGSGKSRLATQKSLEVSRISISEPNAVGRAAYFKPCATKWWDGYANQRTIVFDDFRPGTYSLDDVLRICDRYPLEVERKGSSFKLNASCIIFTSNKPPNELFTDYWNSNRLPHEDLNQLFRRIAEGNGFVKYVPYTNELSTNANTMLMANQWYDYCRQHSTTGPPLLLAPMHNLNL